MDALESDFEVRLEGSGLDKGFILVASSRPMAEAAWVTIGKVGSTTALQFRMTAEQARQLAGVLLRASSESADLWRSQKKSVEDLLQGAT